MDYQILGQEVEDHAWFNMKTDFKNQFGSDGFSKNDFYYNQKDIEEQTDRIEELIDIELNYFFDKDPSRVFIGGITNGASIAIASYLRYKRDKPLGGIMSLYGVNPT